MENVAYKDRESCISSSTSALSLLANTSQADEEKSRETVDSIKERRVIKMVVFNSTGCQIFVRLL
jgi:hypothetical protein